MSRVTAVERVQRILAVLPWIVAHQGVTVDEVCERFALDRKSLIDDLEHVFYNVGIHPFTPDVLADVLIEDDHIYVTLGDYFNRPLRLGSAEALGLLTAAKAALGLGSVLGDSDEARGTGGDDQLLRSAIAKLEDSLELPSSAALDVRLPDVDPEVLGTINRALAAGHRLRLNYYSFGRDQLGERVVDPWSLTNRSGHWYLRAWCNTAGGEREFRLDRIYEADELEEPSGTRQPGDDARSESPGRTRTITIVGGPEIGWVARSYPVDTVEELADGRLRVVLPVATRHWLERLLLRLPSDVAVSDADSGEDLIPLRTSAARRILDRYGVV